MHLHPPRLQPADLDTARAVVLNPVRFHNNPDARLDAWAALKLARGEQINPLRLRLFQERIAAADHLFGRGHLVFARPMVPEAPFYDGMAS